MKPINPTKGDPTQCTLLLTLPTKGVITEALLSKAAIIPFHTHAIRFLGFTHSNFTTSKIMEHFGNTPFDLVPHFARYYKYLGVPGAMVTSLLEHCVLQHVTAETHSLSGISSVVFSHLKTEDLESIGPSRIGTFLATASPEDINRVVNRTHPITSAFLAIFNHS